MDWRIPCSWFCFCFQLGLEHKEIQMNHSVINSDFSCLPMKMSAGICPSRLTWLCQHQREKWWRIVLFPWEWSSSIFLFKKKTHLSRNLGLPQNSMMANGMARLFWSAVLFFSGRSNRQKLLSSLIFCSTGISWIGCRVISPMFSALISLRLELTTWSCLVHLSLSYCGCLKTYILDERLFFLSCPAKIEFLPLT